MSGRGRGRGGVGQPSSSQSQDQGSNGEEDDQLNGQQTPFPAITTQLHSTILSIPASSSILPGGAQPFPPLTSCGRFSTGVTDYHPSVTSAASSLSSVTIRPLATITVQTQQDAVQMTTVSAPVTYL